MTNINVSIHKNQISIDDIGFVFGKDGTILRVDYWINNGESNDEQLTFLTNNQLNSLNSITGFKNKGKPFSVESIRDLIADKFKDELTVNQSKSIMKMILSATHDDALGDAYLQMFHMVRNNQIAKEFFMDNPDRVQDLLQSLENESNKPSLPEPKQ